VRARWLHVETRFVLADRLVATGYPRRAATPRSEKNDAGANLGS
jgi:hypothetical protein